VGRRRGVSRGRQGCAHSLHTSADTEARAQPLVAGLSVSQVPCPFAPTGAAPITGGCPSVHPDFGRALYHAPRSAAVGDRRLLGVWLWPLQTPDCTASAVECCRHIRHRTWAHRIEQRTRRVNSCMRLRGCLAALQRRCDAMRVVVTLGWLGTLNPGVP